MHAVYADRIMRAFRQAPWRSQTQAVAAWSITLLVAAVLGGLYLAVASRAGTAGRDLQDLEASKAELTRTNDELRSQLAQLRSVQRLGDRARALGFAPAEPEQIEYIAVANYPQPVVQQAQALPTPSAATAARSGWLTDALRDLVSGGG